MSNGDGLSRSVILLESRDRKGFAPGREVYFEVTRQGEFCDFADKYGLARNSISFK